MGRFAGLVAELERCADAAARAFESAQGAGSQVGAADLGELVAALARTDRAVQAASVAAVAQLVRREEVPDPEDVAGVVELVHGVGFVEEFAPAEVAMVLGISTRSADCRVERAAQLTLRLPKVLSKVAQGLVELGQADRVLHEVEQIEDLDLVRAVDAYVAERIGACDPTRLGALARYAICRICAQALRAQATKNRAERTLQVRPGPAGLAEVYALVPSAQAAALWEAADELARGYLQDEPSLSLEQARADAFVDLALANVHVTARLDLGVPVLASQSSGLGEAPSEPGRDPAPGPEAGGVGAGRDLTSAADAEEWDRRRDVDTDPWYARHTGNEAPPKPSLGEPAASTADAAPANPVPEALRHLAATAGVCSGLPSGAVISGVHLPRVGYVPADVVAALVTQLGTKIGLAILDAHTGTLLGTVRQAYRPDAAMRHFITIRDGRCRMFGCQLTAQHWDLDHAVAHPDGATTPTNLSGLCRRHHRAKQRRGWRYHLRPDGVAVWQSPTGTTRVTYPEHHLPPPPDPPPPEPEPEPEPEHSTSRLDDEPPF